MTRLLVLAVLLGGCGETREHPAVQVCASCTADQVCVYVTVMTNATTTSETARCIARTASCSQEAAAKSGNCSDACKTQFCGGGSPAACSYQAGPSTVPAAEVTVLCQWG